MWCVMLREQLRDAQWGSCGLTGAAGGKPLTSGQGLACRASFLSESLLETGCKYLSVLRQGSKPKPQARPTVQSNYPSKSRKSQMVLHGFSEGAILQMLLSGEP